MWITLIEPTLSNLNSLSVRYVIFEHCLDHTNRGVSIYNVKTFANSILRTIENYFTGYLTHILWYWFRYTFSFDITSISLYFLKTLPCKKQAIIKLSVILQWLIVCTEWIYKYYITIFVSCVCWNYAINIIVPIVIVVIFSSGWVTKYKKPLFKITREITAR